MMTQVAHQDEGRGFNTVHFLVEGVVRKAVARRYIAVPLCVNICTFATVKQVK
jgi:hypothetical protein